MTPTEFRLTIWLHEGVVGWSRCTFGLQFNLQAARVDGFHVVANYCCCIQALAQMFAEQIISSYSLEKHS